MLLYVYRAGGVTGIAKLSLTPYTDGPACK